MRFGLIQTFSLVSLSVVLCNPALGQHHQNPQQVPIELDRRPYPIDSRKPCNICTRPNDWKAIPVVDLPGLRGRPHLDKPVGGCTCGKKCGDQHPMVSQHWSLPFSAIRENKRPNFSAWLEDPCRPRFTNVYDRIGDFKLIPYQRKDNGYCGVGRDPYGCLGESRQLQSRVSGLQFRQPGEPVFGSPTTFNGRNMPVQQPLTAGGNRYDLESFRQPTRR